MRTIVEIPDELVDALDRMKAREKASRSQLIRKAIDSFLHAKKASGLNQRPGFGSWGKRGPEGLEHQRRMRSEWSR
jgi:metal-responsive CopG/Arc/MetJ family transcriptional regulator